MFTQYAGASGKSHFIYQIPESFVMQIILLFSSYQQFNLGQDWLTRMSANQFQTRLGWGPMEICQNLPYKDKVDSWSHFGNAFAHYLIIWSILYAHVSNYNSYFEGTLEERKRKKITTPPYRYCFNNSLKIRLPCCKCNPFPSSSPTFLELLSILTVMNYCWALVFGCS